MHLVEREIKRLRAAWLPDIRDVEQNLAAISRTELTHCDDGVSAHHVRHKPADLLIISDVIAQQLRIGFRELGSAHAHVPLIKLARVKKFTGWRSR